LCGFGDGGFVVFGVLGLRCSFFDFFEVVDGFFCAGDHIVFGVELIVPVDDLIHAEGHAGSDFGSDGRWLYRGYDLMLELSDDFVDEEDGGFGGEHAHGDVVEGEGGSSILSDLDVLSFAVDGLDLQGFR
jgi:hypothetical protein